MSATDRILTPPIDLLVWLFFRADRVRTPLRLKEGRDW